MTATVEIAHEARSLRPFHRRYDGKAIKSREQDSAWFYDGSFQRDYEGFGTIHLLLFQIGPSVALLADLADRVQIEDKDGIRTAGPRKEGEKDTHIVLDGGNPQVSFTNKKLRKRVIFSLNADFRTLIAESAVPS